MAKGSPWVVSSCMGEEYIAVHKQVCGGPVCINEGCGKSRAEPLDIEGRFGWAYIRVKKPLCKIFKAKEGMGVYSRDGLIFARVR